jgi:CRISPR-associated exonuclease Cas4
MTDWLLEVTDLKQYMYCPRIVFYRYCLPRIRPTTYTMEEGIRSHQEEDEREERRSLHTYGLTQGERVFHVPLQSRQLGLTGCLDLAIMTPSRTDPHASAFVVEYKLSERQAGLHFKLQLAAYALLIEAAWEIPVTQGFLYSISLRRAESIAITPLLRQKVNRTIVSIRQMIERECLPSPPTSLRRCPSCEFRRFCNDVV